MKTEILDYVNEKNVVIGSAPRAVVKRRKLNYRTVNILLFNSKGEMLLCKRPKNQQNYPNVWTASAGGHVKEGESFRKAAYRELREEIGIKTPLTRCFTYRYQHPRGSLVFMDVWNGVWDGQLRLDSSEIARHEYLQPMKIQKMMKRKPKSFAAPFLQIFQEYSR
jgi:isopentenyldiphosphate isomerase